MDSNQRLTNKAFKWGIFLNILFVIIELVYGFLSDSLSLMTDAFHNLSDVAGLVLSLFAFRLSFWKSTEKFTYGYKKSTILVSIVNSVILLIAVGAIGFESLKRLSNPGEIQETTVIIVASIGILVNGIVALFFYKDKSKDLNLKTAYLHMAADALISLGVVISAVIMYFTNYYILDPIMSLIIVIVIIIATYKVLKESVSLSMDAVPENINLNDIKNHILQIEGIKSVHHLHIWSMSTTQVALTAHIILEGNPDIKSAGLIKNKINNMLTNHNITHSTIEYENRDENCENEEC